MWIPIVLITDRLTYYFYLYPTIGAVAIAMAIVITKLNNSTAGKWTALVWLTGHTAAFIVLCPLKLWLSIPLCLMLLAYMVWSLGILKKPVPENHDTADTGAELIPALQEDASSQIVEDSAAIQVDKQSEQ
jgi:chromate transport protein ChrA